MSKEENDIKLIEKKIEKHGIGQYKKHIFICAGPKCCEDEVGDEAWEHLKSRTNALKAQGINIFRTRTKCLRICASGPIALVYPDGTWYKKVDKKALDKIIDKHLLKGRPVEELLIAENPMTED